MSIQVPGQPESKNFLSPLGFRFVLSRTPNTNFFVQSISLPTLSLGQFDLEDPFVKLPLPGIKLNFDPLAVTFMVDENLNNYTEIFNWLNGLGFPESFEQYENLVRSTSGLSTKSTETFSDGTLIVLSSKHNPNLRITFQDMFPISLSELSFDATQTDVEYLKATVVFRYRLYTIARI